MNRLNVLTLCALLVVVSVLGDRKVTDCITRNEFLSTIDEILKQNNQIEILRERVNELEKLTANQQKEIKKYHDRFTHMEEEAYNYRKSNETDIHLTPTQKKVHGNGGKRNIGDSPSQIAFFAQSENLSDLGKHQAIVFSKVKTNIGNLYNAHTGVFYCDVAGVYVFFITIVSEENRSVWTYLDKDGSVIGYTASPRISSDYGTCSNMAVIHLERGDSVTVKSYQAYSGGVVDTWSTFSGFLLYPSV